MEKSETLKKVAMVFNVLVVISAIMIGISMFMPYMRLTAPGNITESLGTGWKYLTNKSTSGRLMAYLVLCVIFAIALCVMGVLRLLGIEMFNSKLFSFIFAGVGIVMLIISVMTFVGFKDTSVLNITKHGSGLIVNLVFSIIAMLTTLGSAVITALFD